ncbi:MAG: hypothetical protein HKN81_01815 [Gammaproteobacteria bacterium]|nr:hypothetical protein [Gammaproteobacteria bacterium]
MRRLLLPGLAGIWLVAGWPALAQDGLDISGRVAGRYTASRFPDNSIFNELTGSSAHDGSVVARPIFKYDRDRWDFRADYEFAMLYGDRIEYSRELPPEFNALFGRLPDDRRRLFDLTSVIEDEGKTAILHRLDRLSVGYTAAKTVVRFGRQAITWGNGMIYTPMDIFNPFDPAAIDIEFKTGDDMLYGQYLRDSGDDVQTVMVFRRDPVTGDVEADESSLAFKYHGVGANHEFDALASQHYGEPLFGIGGNRGIGGAVWRGDVTVAVTDDDDAVASLVTSLSYSWMWGGKNVSGVAEYFFNGFGQRDGDYDPDSLAQNTELLERLARGELFTLGRHYVAAAATIEMTPLFLLIPNAFVNLSDGSMLLQLVTQNDLRENLLLLAALNIPVGPDGSEFGGIETGLPDQYLSTSFGVFAQINWYF